jgi:uncharacterized membrane protein YcaP (DUF421 family)
MDAMVPARHHRRVWTLAIPIWELVLRSAVVYIIFLVALRLNGKRELGQFTVFDLALILLVANALQPAVTGPDASIPGAVVIVVTLFGMNRIVAMLRRRVPIVRRFFEFSVTVIARDGKWIASALSEEGLDDDDLGEALREHGLESVSQVKLAALEQDGSISIVPKDGGEMRIRARRRVYRHGTGGGG